MKGALGSQLKQFFWFCHHHSNLGRENPEKNPCPDSAGHVPGPHRKIPGTVRVRVATFDIRVGPGQPQTRTRPGLLPSLVFRDSSSIFKLDPLTKFMISMTVPGSISLYYIVRSEHEINVLIEVTISFNNKKIFSHFFGKNYFNINQFFLLLLLCATGIIKLMKNVGWTNTIFTYWIGSEECRFLLL